MMTKTWERQKAYAARRAAELKAAMEQAIATHDLNAFIEAHQTSFRYMTKRERKPYYERMLLTMLSD